MTATNPQPEEAFGKRIDLAHTYQTISYSPAPITPLPPLRSVKVIGGATSNHEHEQVQPGPGLRDPLWVDGIQKRMLLRWHRHRPIYLCYASAGAAHSNGIPGKGAMIDRLFVACSKVDHEWLRPRLHPRLEILTVDDADADTITTEVSQVHREVRHQLEQTLAQRLLTEHDGTVVVDGPLGTYQADPRLLGIVKTHPVAVYTPESWQTELEQGWRTAPFQLHDHRTGEHRWASYLRFHPLGDRHPLHALVRLEAFDPDRLDNLAVSALDLRQGPASGDERWPVHLRPIARVERILRAGLPGVFRYAELGL
jgi:hypothetical protein